MTLEEIEAMDRGCITPTIAGAYLGMTPLQHFHPCTGCAGNASVPDIPQRQPDEDTPPRVHPLGKGRSERKGGKVNADHY